MKAKLRHFLQFKDFSRAELEHVFARTKWIKTKLTQTMATITGRSCSTRLRT